MKIWIPTIDDRGPEGLPSAHFGASPFFTFFDLDTGEWEVFGNPSGGHEHGACRPLDAVLARPADALLCGGLGGGAFSRLQRAGLKVFLVREPTVGACLEAFKEGRVRELSESEVCQGHGHSHSHSHSHGHGHGPGGHGHGHGHGGGHGHGLGYSQGQGREAAGRGEPPAITPAEEGF
jgi:predicted Fe-Mo cluster-binding NifX family protein